MSGLGGITSALATADTIADAPTGAIARVDAWLRGVVGQHHPDLGRLMCPFVPPALERGTVSYVSVAGCKGPDDVVSVMNDLIELFGTLPPQSGRDAQLNTLVAVFVDPDTQHTAGIVLAAHHELKTRATERGLMVGEFAPGYELASARNPDVNVGESPLPILALRHMLPSDRRFLQAEDRWLVAWARRFGADRVPLFRAFSYQDLAAIVRISQIVTVPPGRVLCHQNDVGNELFLILEGEASVQRNGNLVDQVGPGAYFGELALLTPNPRNATVAATSDMTLLVIGREAFRNLVDTIPAIRHVLLAGLAQRLYEADARSASS